MPDPDNLAALAVSRAFADGRLSALAIVAEVFHVHAQIWNLIWREVGLQASLIRPCSFFIRGDVFVALPCLDCTDLLYIAMDRPGCYWPGDNDNRRAVQDTALGDAIARVTPRRFALLWDATPQRCDHFLDFRGYVVTGWEETGDEHGWELCVYYTRQDALHDRGVHMSLLAKCIQPSNASVAIMSPSGLVDY